MAKVTGLDKINASSKGLATSGKVVVPPTPGIEVELSFDEDRSSDDLREMEETTAEYNFMFPKGATLLDKSKNETNATPQQKIVDPFTEMIAVLKNFLETNSWLSPLRLTVSKETDNFYLIYQGQKSIVWCRLRNDKTSRFERTSLLRIILGLEDTHPLKMYFKRYSLRTGEEDATL